MDALIDPFLSDCATVVFHVWTTLDQLPNFSWHVHILFFVFFLCVCVMEIFVGIVFEKLLSSNCHLGENKVFLRELKLNTS